MLHGNESDEEKVDEDVMSWMEERKGRRRIEAKKLE